MYCNLKLMDHLLVSEVVILYCYFYSLLLFYSVFIVYVPCGQKFDRKYDTMLHKFYRKNILWPRYMLPKFNRLQYTHFTTLIFFLRMTSPKIIQESDYNRTTRPPVPYLARLQSSGNLHAILPQTPVHGQACFYLC